MARVTHRKPAVHVEARIVLELTEAEARALAGIFGYNVENFLKEFYRCMGRNYVEPFEAGVRSLHETMRDQLAQPLSEIDKVRRKITDALTIARQ